MSPEEDKINQEATIKNSENIDVKNFKIDNVEKLEIHNHYGKVSDSLETKEFEDNDKTLWESEDTIISLEDFKMLKEIIKKEEEIKETLPLLESFKTVFCILPSDHKGLFITALQTIIKEDKLAKRIYGPEDSPSSKVYKDVITLLLEEEEEQESYGTIFIPEIHEEYKKIYNIIRSDDLKRKIIPKIESLKKIVSDSAKLKERFGRYWYSRLDNHPYAVFINFISKRWKTKILDKFDNYEKENVRIYARSQSRVIYAKELCKEIAESKKIKLKEKEYHIGSQDATEIIFEE